MKPRRLFALDQNFPVPLCDALKQWLPADLVSVRDIDPHLAEVDDWELLQALHRDPRQWDGLITSDDSMLKLAKEMVVLSQTRLQSEEGRANRRIPRRDRSQEMTGTEQPICKRERCD